uniref:Uncharacterized protein n=1 Tax=Rhizophora mucronata TaxID=61149 RepID=A0A2P2L3C4_RHIMU
MSSNKNSLSVTFLKIVTKDKTMRKKCLLRRLSLLNNRLSAVKFQA